MPKKGEYVKFKIYERKIKSLFIMCVDFESILVPEDNEKQNPEESYTNRYQISDIKHIASSYGDKLVCVDDELSKSFKTFLGGDAVYNFINNIIENSKYCSDVIKKYFNKELEMTILRTLLNVRSVAMIIL